MPAKESQWIQIGLKKKIRFRLRKVWNVNRSWKFFFFILFIQQFALSRLRSLCHHCTAPLQFRPPMLSIALDWLTTTLSRLTITRSVGAQSQGRYLEHSNKNKKPQCVTFLFLFFFRKLKKHPSIHRKYSHHPFYGWLAEIANYLLHNCNCKRQRLWQVGCS